MGRAADLGSPAGSPLWAGGRMGGHVRRALHPRRTVFAAHGAGQMAG